MSFSTFVGRREELKLLDRLWSSQRSTLVIVYGRRRIGKTRLLTHWLEEHEDDALYWMAEPTSKLDQLRSFSQALINFADPETPASPDFTYDSWEHALRQASLLARERRVALFIDEITYIIDVDPDIVGTLQKAWDQWLSKSNVMMALCGSQMGLMQKHLLRYDAPLYGRATATVKLPPLPFSATREFFPNYSAEERVQIYGIWGGIPAYWERLDLNVSIMENLQYQLSTSNTWMLDESRLLLQDFVSDPYNYVGIMRAIADGKHSLGEIADRIGISGSPTSMYLSILRDTGFVVRRVPVTKRGTESRMGRYYVTDPYLRFYYRFLAAYHSKLALGKQSQMLDNIEENLPQFIEDNTWQELCHQWVLLAGDRGVLPFSVEEVGSEWKRSYTIDIVGLNREKRSLVLGSCDWANTPDPEAAVNDLIRRTPRILPDDGEWSVHYLLCSAHNGWSAKEKEAAVTLTENQRKRKKNWHPTGVQFLTLEDIDNDLDAWSMSD